MFALSLSYIADILSSLLLILWHAVEGLIEHQELRMNEYGAKVYGEGAERIGLKKLCKVCFEIKAQEKGIKGLKICYSCIKLD